MDTMAAHPRVNSFDLFDTLVARRCGSPLAVFDRLERQGRVPGLAAARIAAEASLYGGDYTLDDIYAAIRVRTGLPQDAAETLVRAELAIEWDELIPIAETIAMVRPGDIVVSDMYLPFAFVERVVCEKAGLPFVQLHLSARGKSSGRIWPALAAHYDIACHTGDNPHSDVASPTASGIPARLVEPSVPTAMEHRMCGAGLANLAAAMRTARLATRHSDPALRLVQLMQIQLNFPLLVLASMHLRWYLREVGATRALLSSRDGHKWSQVMAKSGIGSYFYTSRVARARASADYIDYVKLQAGDGRAIIADICGTGWSLKRLLAQAGCAERIGIYLLHYMDDSPLLARYRQWAEVSDAFVPCAVRGGGFSNQNLELLNATDHPMVDDVARIGGRFVPRYRGRGFEGQARDLVKVQDAAFAAALAAWQPDPDLPEAELGALVAAVYNRIGACDMGAYRCMLEQQRVEETAVLAILEQGPTGVLAAV